MTPTNAAADASDGRSGARDPGEPSARSERQERFGWSLIVFAAALGVRAVHLWQLRGSLVLQTIMGDSRSYDAWAREIAAGNWLGNEVFYQAPLYPYFLGTLYTLVGDDPFVVRSFQVLIGSLSCVLLAQAGWRFFGKAVGIGSGLALAVYAPALFADTTLQKSVLVVFFLCLALWILGGLAARPRRAGCLALGAAIGALVLVRENALVFALVLLPWLLLRAPGRGAARLVPAALFATGMALLLLPVALRNLHVGGELHLTTSQLGPNLYIGNNPAAQGTYAPLVPGRGDPAYERRDATAIAERALGRPASPSEVSRYFTGLVLEYVRSQPGQWLSLLARKTSLTFNAVEIVDTEDQYTHAQLSLPLRLATAVFHFGVLAPLALLGLFVSWPSRRKLLPLYLLLVAYAGSLVAFYVFARYRLPLVPLLIPFAVAGLLGLRRFAAEASRPVLAVALGCVLLAAAYCNRTIVEKDYMRSVTHYNLGNELFDAGRRDEAEEHYRLAISLHDRNAEAYNNLGVVFASRDDLTSAREHYEQALRISPDHADARFNLARSQLDAGDPLGAIENFEHGLRVQVRADALNDLGMACIATGDLDRAAVSFEQALQIDPELDAARRNLRLVRAEQRRQERSPGT